jgi:hypothetical protein
MGRKGLLMASSFFHRYACALTLWYPVIEGVSILICSDSLEVAKSAERFYLFEIRKAVFCAATSGSAAGALERRPEFSKTSYR